MYFFFVSNQAKKEVQQNPRFCRQDSDIALEWIYFLPLALDHCHKDTTSRTGNLAPPPLTTCSCMHRSLEQNLRRAVIVFRLFLGYQETGRTHRDFCGQREFWLLPEHEEVQKKKKEEIDEGTKRQKTSWLEKEKWQVGRTESGEKWPS